MEAGAGTAGSAAGSCHLNMVSRTSWKNLCCSVPLDGCCPCHQGVLPRAELGEKAEPDRLGGGQERRDTWLEVAAWGTGAQQRKQEDDSGPLRVFAQSAFKT